MLKCHSECDHSKLHGTYSQRRETDLREYKRRRCGQGPADRMVEFGNVMSDGGSTLQGAVQYREVRWQTAL